MWSLMTNRVAPENKLSKVLKVRFSPNDIVFLESVAKEEGLEVSALVRATVRRAIIDRHHRIMTYYPPTLLMYDRINKKASETGMTMNQLISNVVNYHFSILDVGVLDEDFINLLKNRIEDNPILDQS